MDSVKIIQFKDIISLYTKNDSEWSLWYIHNIIIYVLLVQYIFNDIIVNIVIYLLYHINIINAKVCYFVALSHKNYWMDFNETLQ